MKSRMRRCLAVTLSIAIGSLLLGGDATTPPPAIQTCVRFWLDFRTCVRHTLAMARTRVRWGRVGTLLGVTSMAAVLAGGHALASNATPVVARYHVVRPGETVWSISRAIVGPEGDPRPVVDQVIG